MKIQNGLLLLYLFSYIHKTVPTGTAGQAHPRLLTESSYCPFYLHSGHVMGKYKIAWCFSINGAIFIELCIHILQVKVHLNIQTEFGYLSINHSRHLTWKDKMVCSKKWLLLPSQSHYACTCTYTVFFGKYLIKPYIAEFCLSAKTSLLLQFSTDLNKTCSRRFPRSFSGRIFEFLIYWFF